MILTKASISKVDLNQLVDSLVSEKKINELLLVVPTNRKARKIKKEIILQIPGQAVTEFNIETIGTLTTKILKEHKSFVELSEAAATLFIKASSGKADLKYFSMNEGEIPRGTLEKVKNVITEYKKHNISPSTLRNESEKLEGSEKLKALDIANIYEEYLNRSSKKNAFEIGDIYNAVLNIGKDKILEILAKLYPSVNRIIINGFDEFTSPEIDIIDVLSTRENTSLFLNFDYNNYNNEIFAHLDKCYDRFAELGFKRVDDISISGSNQFEDIVKHRFFKTKSAEKNKSFLDKIVRISAKNRENEIELIAKQIKKLIISEKTEPHKICVSFNQIQKYSGIIRDSFRKYKIPFNLTDRLALENSLPVTALVNFIEISENNFFHKNIFRALSSGFIDLEKVDFGNLNTVSKELNIISGYKNWEFTLKDARKKVKFEVDPARKNWRLDSYNKALRDIKIISDLLKPFEENLTIKEFYEKLKNLAHQLKIPYLVLQKADGKEEEYIKGFTYFFETIKEVFELIEIEDGKDKKNLLTYYLDQIRTVCNWARFNIKERADYGVQITSNNEIRGLKFDYLFMAGLTDGDFPTKFTPEIFFSGSFSKKERDHQTQERYLFYQTLCCWTKKLFISIPALDEQKELSESTFATELCSHFEVTEKGNNEFENKIFSDDELQIEAGLLGIDSFKAIYKEYEKYVQLNLEVLEKVLQIEESRITGDERFGDYRGHLDLQNSEIESDLEKYREREYSISQLETFAACPFKFFIERILKLDIPSDPTEDMEAMELGSILHSIFFAFFIKLREKKIRLKYCNDSDFEIAEKLILEIAEEKFPTDENSSFSFIEKEKIFGLEGNKKRSLLYNFLEFERNREDNYEPDFFELSFGSVDRSETDEKYQDIKPIKAGNINLRGKIDRVDINSDEKLFNVVDYKLSGKKPTKEELYEGLKLQLPIYMYVVKQILSDDENELKPVLMQIFSLKQQEKSFGFDNVNLTRKKLDDDDLIQMNEELISSLIEKIQVYVENIAEGKFSLTDNEEKACKWCKFKSVCRIKDIKKK
ncbi:MAG: exodeoxyribonuclease V subunit gamma [Melioribacteraceae bacterium]|nr:exodeoxyribonuclease V subunit gamma [Melioribacteraceae bacterium]